MSASKFRPRIVRGLWPNADYAVLGAEWDGSEAHLDALVEAGDAELLVDDTELFGLVIPDVGDGPDPDAARTLALVDLRWRLDYATWATVRARVLDGDPDWATAESDPRRSALEGRD